MGKLYIKSVKMKKHNYSLMIYYYCINITMFGLVHISTKISSFQYQGQVPIQNDLTKRNST
jgi:hypothetical protein